MSIFGTLWRSLGKDTTPTPPAALSAHQVDQPHYVIGDIHGRMDLLAQLSDVIVTDAEGRPGMTDAIVVYVGDYIDRGDQSAQVLTHLFDLSQAQPDRHICLKGNHEVMMLQALQDPVEYGGRWLRYGGMQTLASFGIRGIHERMDAEDLDHAMAQLRRALPAGMQDWLNTLPKVHRSGNVVVVHAALNPDRDWQDQSDRTRLWGKDTFFERPHKDGLWVVHGHTIVDQAVIADGRMSIDTGGYATGRLTSVGLNGDQAWLLGT
ncbi:MAG: metallophosphoesterase family protein [Pseudomonadota bacterium]